MLPSKSCRALGKATEFYDASVAAARGAQPRFGSILLIIGVGKLFRPFGLCLALLVAVISPSALATADPAAPPLMSGPSNASATNAPGGSGRGADSFQNIFAQAVAPSGSTQSGSALTAQDQSVVTAPVALGASSKANFVLTLQSTTGVAPQPLADSTLQSAAGLAAKPASGPMPQQTSGAAQSAAVGDDAHLTGARFEALVTAAKLPQQALGRAASLKGAPRPAARQTQSSLLETAGSGINNDALASNQAPAADSTVQTASAPGKGVILTSPAEQAFAGPVAARGGTKPLAGAAFLLHLKPDASQGAAAREVNSSAGNAAADAANSACDAALAPSQTAASPSGKTDAFSTSTLTLPTGGLGSSVAEAAPRTSSAPPMGLTDTASRAESAGAPLNTSAVADDSSSGAAQPVRTVQVQLAGTDDRRVDVRLVEHAGGLSVSVRASDGVLTSSLQEHLPELSARLAAEHYETQVFVPLASQISHGGSAGSSGQQPGQSSGQSPDQGGGRSFSQGGSSSGGDGNQRQGRQPDQPQEWQSPFVSSAPSSPAISFASELSMSTPAMSTPGVSNPAMSNPDFPANSVTAPITGPNSDSTTN